MVGRAGAAARPRTLAVLTALLLAALIGWVAGTSFQLGAALAVGIALVIYAVLLRDRPKLGAVVWFSAIALIPVYVAPNVQAISPQPAIGIAAATVAALYSRTPGGGLTVVDRVFALLCGIVMLAALLGPANVLSTGATVLFWVISFTAGRMLCTLPDGPKLFASGASIAGILAVPVVVYELITQSNPYFQLANAASEHAELWARPDFRFFGGLRTEGAFGHPLTMALVLAACAVFAVALAARAHRPWARVGWLTAAVVLVAAQATTDERSGWVVFGGGLLLFAVAGIPRRQQLRGAYFGSLLLVPVLLIVFVLAGGTGGGDTAKGSAAAAKADSVQYRRDMYEHALDRNALALLGLRVTQTSNPFTDGVRAGYLSIDSTYLQIGVSYGIAALFALLGLVGTVVAVLMRARGQWVAAVPAATLAVLVALLVIGLQTQVPIFAMALIGATAGVAANMARRDRPPASPSQ